MCGLVQSPNQRFPRDRVDAGARLDDQSGPCTAHKAEAEHFLRVPSSVAMGSGFLGQASRLEHSQASLKIADATFHAPAGRARGDGAEAKPVACAGSAAGFEAGPYAHRHGRSQRTAPR